MYKYVRIINTFINRSTFEAHPIRQYGRCSYVCLCAFFFVKRSDVVVKRNSLSPFYRRVFLDITFMLGRVLSLSLSLSIYLLYSIYCFLSIVFYPFIYPFITSCFPRKASHSSKERVKRWVGSSDASWLSRAALHSLPPLISFLFSWATLRAIRKETFSLKAFVGMYSSLFSKMDTLSEASSMSSWLWHGLLSLLLPLLLISIVFFFVSYLNSASRRPKYSLQSYW